MACEPRTSMGQANQHASHSLDNNKDVLLRIIVLSPRPNCSIILGKESYDNPMRVYEIQQK